MTSTKHRRQFLAAAAGALAAPFVLRTAAGQHAAAPSQRITVGVIGLGSRGFNLIDSLLQQPDAQIIAICDVDERHYRDRPVGQGPAYGRLPAQQKIQQHVAARSRSGSARAVAVYNDYRQLCARRDLDVVVIATPDHWHALNALEALRTSKDVYCEKPVTHLFHEGQVLYREVAQRQAVFQTGSQQRSDPLFRHAVELVRNGHIGKVRQVEVGLPPGYDAPQGDPTVQLPPEHLDYDLWCGPSAVLPYMRARHHRWWRGHLAYGGGVLMDWIGHHNDIAHWALDLDRSGPLCVEAVNWIRPETDIYNTPQHYELRCEYPGGISSTISSRHPVGTKWIGDEGWIFVTRGKLEASEPRWTRLDFDPGPTAVYASSDHMRNFLDCVKSRQPCIAPAETAHHSITPGHLGYLSYRLGKVINWDPVQEQVIGDDAANGLLREISYRQPWALSG